MLLKLREAVEIDAFLKRHLLRGVPTPSILQNSCSNFPNVAILWLHGCHINKQLEAVEVPRSQEA